MKNTKNGRGIGKGLAIFIVLFIVLYGIIYVAPKVSDAFTRTYIAEYGTLEADQRVPCVFVRKEQVYKAQTGGKIERKAEEGQLLRAGNTVITLGNTELRNDSRGVVSYFFDGYESRLTPENAARLHKDFLSEYEDNDENKVEEAAKSSAEPGNVLFKIIDNSKWYMVCWLTEDEAAAFQAGRDITVEPEKGVTVIMTVESVTRQGDDIQLILSCDRNYENFDKYRVKECRLISSSGTGIILNTDSISEENGVKGVYVVDKYRNANFTPVNVLFSWNGKTVVSKDYFLDEEGEQVATVGSYAEVLKKAKTKDKNDTEGTETTKDTKE